MSRVYEVAIQRVEVPDKGETLDPAQLFEAFERMAADWPSPENYLPRIKEQVTKILVARGYPAPEALVLHRGRKFRTCVAGEQAEPGETMNLGWKFACHFADPLTPEREAAEIYVKVVAVENALAGADAAQVFAHAFRLGAAIERFNLRRLHLKAVDAGVKNLRAVKIGGERNSAAHEPLRNRRFAGMGELVPKSSVNRAAKLCEREGLGTADNIKRQWNRWKEKRDTARPCP